MPTVVAVGQSRETAAYKRKRQQQEQLLRHTV